MKSKTNLKTVIVDTEKNKRSWMEKFNKTILYLFLSFGVGITFFPFYYMLVLATRSREEIFNFPPPLWFGGSSWDNLQILLEKLPFFQNIFNSIIVSSLATLLVLFFCSLGGYGFAKYNFKGKEKLFFLMLASMMIPSLLSIIPWFIMMRYFGWINSFKPLIIPGAANAFGIFLMRQFMEDIPNEIIDAARIDGAGEFKIYYKIALPLSKPGLATLSILTYLGAWNNFMGPLLVLQEKSKYTISVALSKLNGNFETPWGATMMGTALGVLPIVIVFILASKRFISGLTAGATKG
ncbi:ABC transporter permease subunit [Iocasia frigidifontis]|uniref:ABC transporter permease subunit n=1 Tax=Iocasia fonsfrigidae TaxID=2682810 RepID=A0A8A7KCC2_9FIRM|nr:MULTISPECIES: carbohydrate ABC transporter permease [Halanaerobiaceae]AZO94291.1 carbohydrate ABC transporter permease [Halocella sp. SP3-1]QTL97238.1 ABC transporter permease subunit [Iocasia fonsfrigidae]